MQHGGLRETQNIRQISRMGSGHSMEGQRLVFLYPMLCDSLYQRMLNDFRDFMAVNIVSEIKISNALNITADSYRNVGMIGQGPNSINPAQMVRQSLWAGPDMVQTNQQSLDHWTSQENKAAYQDKINQFNHFLQNQIHHDPRYSRLRPVVSSITIENLINVPLIIGTQTYQIESQYLYLVLLVSLIYGLPLDNQNNLKRIFGLIDIINPQTLLLCINDPVHRAKMEQLIGYSPNTSKSNVRNRFDTIKANSQPTAQGGLKGAINKFRGLPNYNLTKTNISKLTGWINNERTKAELFFNLVLDINRWSTATGGVESRTKGFTLNQLKIPTTPIQQKHYDSAIVSFQQYVENCILPIFNSLELICGPNYAGSDVSVKIEQFLTDVFENLSEDYMAISGMIVNELQEQYTKTSGALSGQLKKIVDYCDKNSDMGASIKKVLDDLDNVAYISGGFSGRQLVQFQSAIINAGNQLDSKQRALDVWLSELTKSTSSNTLSTRIATLLNRFKNIVNSMFFKHYPRGDSFGYPWISTNITDPGDFYNRYTNYCQAVLGYDNQSILGVKTSVISTQINDFYSTINSIQFAIVKMLSFFFEWNFFSYTCSYLKDVEVDIEIQTRDALDFPNYCLVLPFNLFKGLYMTKVIRNMKTLMKQEKLDPALRHIDPRVVIPNMADVNGLIRQVNNQLKIPNIILVDEKTKTCYYKFMYMSKPVKVSLSTMQSYIKHQKDVLPGF